MNCASCSKQVFCDIIRSGAPEIYTTWCASSSWPLRIRACNMFTGLLSYTGDSIASSSPKESTSMPRIKLNSLLVVFGSVVLDF